MSSLILQVVWTLEKCVFPFHSDMGHTGWHWFESQDYKCDTNTIAWLCIINTCNKTTCSKTIPLLFYSLMCLIPN